MLMPCEAILLFNDQPVQCCHRTCASCALVVQAKTFCGHCEEARRQEGGSLGGPGQEGFHGEPSAGGRNGPGGGSLAGGSGGTRGFGSTRSP